MNFPEHPLRHELVREMHLRPFVPVRAPARLIQMVYLVDDERRAEEAELLNRPPGSSAQLSEIEGRHAVFPIGEEAQFLWERHTEATTVSAIKQGRSIDDLDHVAQWMAQWPGAAIRATKIYIELNEKEAGKLLPQMHFAQAELVTCHIKGGVRLWSDFRIRADGFGRLVIAANGAEPDELGRIVQRLQELGNYRNLALLGLPPVQRAMPELNAMEERLAGYSHKLREDTEGEDDELLRDLSNLAADLARARTEHGYRLSATRAYAQIATDRLEALTVEPVKGFQSLTDFTERRLVPANRTCATFADRLRRLSERASDAIALLNTRIDTRIKEQNLELLKSMESSFALQLRLQHLVEALSVIAASYYAVGLLAYILSGTPPFGSGDTIDLLIAVATPLVILSIYLLVSRIRNRVVRDTNGDRPKSGD